MHNASPWETRREEQQKVINAIGQLWDVGIASGASRDGEVAFARVRKQIEAVSLKQL